MDTKTSKGVRLSKAGNAVSAFGGWVILILTLLIFIFLTMQSLLNTTVIYDAPEDPSTVLFYTDNFYINLFIIAVIFLCGVIFLKKLMNKINPKIFAAILLVYIFVLSLIWNLLTKIIPAHDSYYLINAASLFAKNDYSALSSDDKYFIYYPFQLGYTFFAEIIHRISEQNALFILQIFNILSAVAIAAALIFISDLAFKSRQVTNFTTLLLFGCLPLILFTTFHYGNLPGFAFSMWSVVFSCLFIRKRKWYYIVLTAIFIGIGVMLKSNSLIILTAVCILLLLDFLKSHSIKNIIAAVAALVLGIGLNQLIIFQYEQRADLDLGGGVPKVLWLDMGIQENENPNRQGWYNPTYTVLRYYDQNFDEKRAAETGWSDIRKRAGELISNNSMRANFFGTKTLSQWNDPLYMSVWISETRPSKNTEMPEFVRSMYYGNAGTFTEDFANIYQSLLFLFGTAGVFLIIIKKDFRNNIFCLVLPLLFLGGFLYHLLFEAMPQYNITYFTLFIPLAAYGFSELCGKCEPYFKGIFKKRSAESEQKISDETEIKQKLS